MPCRKEMNLSYLPHGLKTRTWHYRNQLGMSTGLRLVLFSTLPAEDGSSGRAGFDSLLPVQAAGISGLGASHHCTAPGMWVWCSTRMEWSTGTTVFLPAVLLENQLQPNPHFDMYYSIIWYGGGSTQEVNFCCCLKEETSGIWNSGHALCRGSSLLFSINQIYTTFLIFARLTHSQTYRGHPGCSFLPHFLGQGI